MEYFSQNSLLILIVILWTLPWKGWALWLSARRGQKWWFIIILIVNTFAILEIFYVFVFSKKKSEKIKNSLL